MASKNKRGKPGGMHDEASARQRSRAGLGRSKKDAAPVLRKPRGPASASPSSAGASLAGAISRASRHPSVAAIVVIGASAGGLEAFRRFLIHMPAESGMAFVLVPHLDPKHESMMAALLSRHTAMPVREAGHRMAIEANHVYVIPPNKYLAIENGRLILSRPPKGASLPGAIDFALCSLARDQHEHAIGIVLSGTGTHGTAGLKEIKLAGGLILVQDPQTAEHGQMPRSALTAGVVVDYVLAPEKMPEALLAYSTHMNLIGAREPVPPDAVMLDGLKNALSLLLARLKSDFRPYRKEMILRRIQRRMALLRIADVRAYVERLRADPAELTALRKDLWIGITAFFREPEAFEVLRKQVLPQLVERTTPELPLRVWIPACATGEEAYSLAILLFEQFHAIGKEPSFQIFATDVDEDSLRIARHGVYPESTLSGVSPERLKRFFTRKDANHFQVGKPLRESIVFAPHNLISDPPFLGIDLISCRNVLIYLDADVQAGVISRMHFALNEGGCLLLGSAESVGTEAGLFEPVSKKLRVFRRIGTPRRERVSRVVGAVTMPQPHTRHRARAVRGAMPPGVLLQRVLLKEFTPAAVLLSSALEILAVQGPVAEYLEFPPGKLTKDLLSMCREGLRARLRSACSKAAREGQLVHDPRAQVRRESEYFHCAITVRPVDVPRQQPGLLLVVFQDLPGAFRDAQPRRKARARGSVDVRRLEDELRDTRDDLQSMIQELEDTNEDLRSSNEEIVSMNEELQSTNEELGSSQEELQSLNEELTTVNRQLEEKVHDLDNANSDLTHLMLATDLAIVFLDRELRIRRFTQPTTKLLNLLETDIGRPFRDVAPRFTGGDVIGDAQRVLQSLVPVEREIQTDDNRWYLQRVLPYRSGGDRVGGAVVTFIDITQRVEMEAEIRRFAAVLQGSSDAITVRDFNGRITAWNRGAEQMYGYSQAEALKLNIRDLVPAEFLEQSLDVMRRVRHGEDVPSFEGKRRSRDGVVKDVWVTVSLLRDSKGQPESFATIERDVTTRRRAEATIRDMNAQLERRVAERTADLMRSEEQTRAILDASADAIVTIDGNGRIVTFSKSAERIFGYTAGEAVGQAIGILMPPAERGRQQDYLERYRETGVPHLIGTSRELTACRKDGTTFPIHLTVSEVAHHGLYVGFVRDMTDYKSLQAEILNIAALEQRRIGQELHDETLQELTGLGLLAQNLSDELARAGSGEAGKLAARLAAGIAQANLHVRSLARGMVPIPIGKDGLMLALAELARSTEQNAGRSCRFECPTPVAVDNDTTATHLYRIAQEAVSNAVRHSKFKALRIVLSREDGRLVIAVHDDGIGIPTAGAPDGGLGLRIMGHRCAIVGGAFAVQRGKEGGTSVSCTIPQASHA